MLVYTLENGLVSLRKRFKSSDTTQVPGSTPHVEGTAVGYFLVELPGNGSGKQTKFVH